MKTRGFTRCPPCFFALPPLLPAFAAIACNQPPAVNPWRDDSIPRETWSTPSRDGVLAASPEPAPRHRPGHEVPGPEVKGDVPHYPLWWEDPLEDKGDQDRVFAWTWQDYVAMPYSFGRFLLNTIGWPLSAAVTPPGTPMLSDGRIGRDHDAATGRSPDPTAGPTDFAVARDELATIPPTPAQPTP